VDVNDGLPSIDGGFDLDAAGLRLDGADLPTSIELLASKLEGALPSATKVERRRKSPLSKDQRVKELEVRLGGCRFALSLKNGGVEAWRTREVGGISIKREPLDPRAWVSALARELHAEAQRSSEARLALVSLLG
jgi:hypothetical protein